MVHTNTVEGTWTHSKKHFQDIVGTNLANFNGHLAEVIWRNHHKNCHIPMLLRSIVNTYRVETDVVDLDLPVNIFSTTFTADNNTHIINESHLNDSDDDEADVVDDVMPNEVAPRDDNLPIIISDDMDVGDADHDGSDIGNSPAVIDEDISPDANPKKKSNTFWANVTRANNECAEPPASEDVFKFTPTCHATDTEESSYGEEKRELGNVTVIPEADSEIDLPPSTVPLSQIQCHLQWLQSKALLPSRCAQPACYTEVAMCMD